VRRLSSSAPMGEVIRNPSMLRVQASWVLGNAAQWTFLVTLLVFAFDAGGVVLTAIVSTARILPAAILAPLVSTLVDRMSPAQVLRLANAGRVLAVGLSAAVLAADLAPVTIVAAAVVEGVLASVVRPATMALLPAIARSPEELVAGNAVTSTGEAAGTLVGPALGGALLAVGGPLLGFVGATVLMAVAAVVIPVIGLPTLPHAAHPGDRRVWSEVTGGFRALGTYRSAGLLISLFSVQTFVRGVLTVLLVAVSVELLGLGDAGVGFLASALGAGGLVGAAASIGLVGARRLALTITISLAAWGIPVALLGLIPIPWLAFVLLGAIGIANAILDVAGLTLVQRLVPNRVRGRVFGALEGVVSLTLALGSLAAPWLHAALGLEGALIVAGVILPILAALTAIPVGRADAAAVVPHEQVALLNGIPMFRPLGMTTIEHLAGSMRPVRFEPGDPLMTQGESGDAYYILTDGEASVRQDGVEIRRLEVGEGCGEIALLRDVPRTASVVADGDVETFRLDREAFLSAVTGTSASRAAADRLVADRLAATPR
jgi:MFS family permease